MRILYVEDNQANVYLVKRVARNHTVINYIDGEEALRNFEKDNPDLVLMDIQLAGRLDGIDVVKKLRAEGHTVPIIAVTAYAMVGDRERCITAGCNDYISKPLPIPKLVTLFQDHDPAGKEKDEKPKTASTKPVVAPAKDDASAQAESVTKTESAEKVESGSEAVGASETVKSEPEATPSAPSEIDVTKPTIENKTQPMPKNLDLKKAEVDKEDVKDTADVVTEKADASKKTS